MVHAATTQIPGKDGLADAMKTHTWALHGEAERTGTIGDLLKQRASLESYVLLARNFLPVYRLLDETFEQVGALPGMHLYFRPGLRRAHALAADVSALAGPAFENDLPLLPETQDYCTQIEQARTQGAAALLGHVYVRYLGDLYGGQTLNRLLGKSLGIEEHALAFYAFGDIPDLISFRNGFRAAINSCAVSDAEFEQALDAAYSGFRSNISVSKQVKALTSTPA